MKRLFIFIMGVMMAVVATSRTFDMKKLGADAKGIKPCTKLINQTIEKAASEGGGTIYFPAGTYLTGSIHLKSNITLETYATDLKQTQVRLTYNDGISDKEPKVLKPKQILFETPQTITFSDKDAPEKYYVYGHGEIQGVYTCLLYTSPSPRDRG